MATNNDGLRRILLGLLVLFVVVPFVHGSLDEDLVAYYPMDYGAGDTAPEIVGGSDGSLNGATWTDGKANKALYFDGDDYVSVGNPSNIQVADGNFTVSAWSYSEDSTCGVQIIDKASNDICGSDGGGWVIGKNYENYQFRVTDSDGTSANVQDPVNREDEWVHTVGVRKGDMIEFYINGESVGTADISGISVSEENLYFGGHTSAWRLNGSIDEVRIYDRALSDSEAKALHNQGSFAASKETNSDQGTVLDVSFGKTNSSHVFDTSGEQNHGEIKHDASQSRAVKCEEGRCFSFDGDLDKIEVQDSESLKVDKLTMMAWVYRTGDCPAEDDTCMIFNKDPTYEWGVRSGNSLDWAISPTGESWFWHDTGINVPLKEWTHVAVTYDGDDTAKSYKNGVLKDTYTFSTGGPVSNSSECLIISGRNDCGADHSQFLGRLDEVKLYNQSLSQEQIVQAARLGEAKKSLDLRFEEEGGDIAKDHSRRDNDALLRPNATDRPIWAQGVVGKSLSFDGENDRVEPPLDSESDKPSHLTVSAWYKTEGDYNDNSLVSDEIFSPDEGFGLYTDMFRVGRGNGSGMVSATTSEEIGRWVHVVGTYDGSTVTMYKNGVKQEENDFTGPYAKSSRQLVIGYNAWRNTNFDPGYGWKGNIDEVRVYPYAVSDSKVKKLYNKGAGGRAGTGERPVQAPSDDSLVLEQGFDRVEMCGRSDTLSCPYGMSGNISVDTSGEGNQGDLLNHPSFNFASKCVSKRCLRFDGNDDFVSTRKDDSFDLTGNVTVSTWIKTSDMTQQWKGIVSKFNSNSEDSFPFEILTNNDQGIRFQVGTGGAHTSLDVNNVEENTWYHVVGTNDDSELKLYVNGREHAVTSLSSSAKANNKVLQIGRRASGGSYFEGTIDEVSIYNKTLSQEKIWSLYAEKGEETGVPGSQAAWRLNQRFGRTAYDTSGEENHGNATAWTYGDGADGSITVTSKKRIDADTVASGRTYPDGASYIVGSTGSRIETLSTPDGIRPGDEVLLVNLQGTSSATNGVGEYRFAEVLDVAGRELQLSRGIGGDFGDPDTQNIVVQRVPNYDDVTVDGGTFTATEWNDTRVATCPHGWTNWEGHCYQAIGEASWPDARSTCRQKGAELVRVNNASENTFVKNNFAPGWIGLHDIGGSSHDQMGGRENIWTMGGAKHVSGPNTESDIYDYVNWGSGEPDGNTSTNYATKIEGGGTWTDLDQSTQLTGICEKVYRKGGVVAFRASGEVSMVNGGTVTVDGKGYRGGDCGYCGDDNDGRAGEGIAGTGKYGYHAETANTNGGAGSFCNDNNGGDPAGGGGYGTSGNTSSNGQDGGVEVGGERLPTMFFGGGGGAGSDNDGASPYPEYSDGGGIAYIAATNISDADVSARGDDGKTDCSGSWYAQSGGGAGGTVYLRGNNVDVASANASGGSGIYDGGDGSNGDKCLSGERSGDGGEGRIRIDADSNTGADPSPASYNDALGPLWSSGEKTSLDFDGSNDYVEVSSINRDFDDITISAWVNLDATSGDQPFVALTDSLSDLDTNNANENFNFAVWNGEWHTNTKSGGSWTSSLDPSSPTPTTGWHHYSAVYDTDGSTRTLYLDGEQIAQDTNYNNPGTITGARIGGKSYGGDTDGRLKDIRIYPYAMTQSQVKSVMNQGSVS